MNKCIRITTLFLTLLVAACAGEIEETNSVKSYEYGGNQEYLNHLLQAAEHGDAKAQNNLGLMYYQGNGVAQDYVAAVKWYRLSAEQGNSKAQNSLGSMYGQGIGVTQDYAAAVKWHRLSAEQGNPKGQRNLGVLYALGNGLAQDFVRAHMWANIAALQKEDNAIKLRDFLVKKMSLTQLETAQRLTRECVEKNYKGC